MVFLLSQGAWAGLTTLAPWINGFPVQGDLTFTTAKEYFLYDKRSEAEPWNYGIWEFQGVASAAGRAELNLIFYPISFFKVSVGYDGFFRYYTNPVFNCQQVNCYGFVQKIKGSVSARLTFGDEDEWAAIPEYISNGISIPNGTSQPIGDETENILANSSGDTIDIAQFFLGRTHRRQTWGVNIRHGQYHNSGQSNDQSLLVVRHRWRDSELMIAAGYYSSTSTVSGTTGMASLTWFWGQTLSTF